jgi:hypothetical protein
MFMSPKGDAESRQAKKKPLQTESTTLRNLKTKWYGAPLRTSRHQSREHNRGNMWTPNTITHTGISTMMERHSIGWTMRRHGSVTGKERRKTHDQDHAATECPYHSQNTSHSQRFRGAQGNFCMPRHGHNIAPMR